MRNLAQLICDALRAVLPWQGLAEEKISDYDREYGDLLYSVSQITNQVELSLTESAIRKFRVRYSRGIHGPAVERDIKNLLRHVDFIRVIVTGQRERNLN
jgi:hypothetical protein